MVVADLDLWSKARITHSLVMPLIQPYEAAFVVDGYPAIQSQMLSRRPVSGSRRVALCSRASSETQVDGEVLAVSSDVTLPCTCTLWFARYHVCGTSWTSVTAPRSKFGYRGSPNEVRGFLRVNSGLPSRGPHAAQC